MTSVLVFVYGTLKLGQRANYMLEGSVYIDEALTDEKFDMYNVGYPIAVPNDNGGNIVGEIYKISTDILKKLDSYEGYPSYYNRKEVKIRGYEEENILMYYQQPTETIRIEAMEPDKLNRLTWTKENN